MKAAWYKAYRRSVFPLLEITGKWLCSRVLKKVPHRHFVFTIPKMLRWYFLYYRDLLSDLS
jgi:hypothetical protein